MNDDDDWNWMTMESIGMSNRSVWLLAIAMAVPIIAVFVWLATL